MSKDNDNANDRARNDTGASNDSATSDSASGDRGDHMSAVATATIELADLDRPPVPVEAVRRLRTARRANRVAAIEWFELAYRAYLSGLIGIIAVLSLAGAIGDSRLPDASIHSARQHGPAAIGVVAALAIALGLRSGSRGGPLALEPAEVRHVLLAPVRRRQALLTLATRQLRYAIFIGSVVGAICGLLASRRLGGTRPAWVASGAAAGIVVALSFVGAALIGSGLRLRRLVVNIIGAAILIGALADLGGYVGWWPTRVVGDLGMWPAKAAPVALVTVIVAIGVVVIGLSLLDRLELEAAERRTELAGQLRFAVTMRDLRTAIVVHRMLAQDRPRPRPLFSMPGRRTVWKRSWRGLARLPNARLARMFALAAGSGLAVLGIYRGTTPLAIVAGLAMYVVGLDLLEPMAQEIDQVDRAAASPHDRGRILVRHVAPPAIVVVIIAAVSWGALAVAGAHGDELFVGAIGVVSIGWSGLAGAAMSLVSGAPDPLGLDGVMGANELLMPEVAGMRMVGRAVGPLVVAMLGAFPTIIARRVAVAGSKATDGVNSGHPIAASATAAAAVVVLLSGVVGWVRFRDQARAYLMQSAAAAKSGQRDKLTGVGR